MGTPEDKLYVLLNDQPVDQADKDLLGVQNIAKDIATVLVASIESSPFVLAVDAGWGMGKSTLLHQIENQLSDRPDIVKLHFNAWTAEGENALEGLIKAVLAKLDPNVLRRTIRRVTQDRRVKIMARLGLGLVARFSGATRLVDELWKQMAIDAKSRNELRDLIHDMLSAWVSAVGTPSLSRALVVFIDDLDRCSDSVVVKVCEAVKLYLDAPGLIFVIACDQSVLARGVSMSAGQGGSGEGRAYLEKIVQVAYRMPPPDDTKLRQLIHEYARASGTNDLVDETVERILAEGTGRNPRRIKRIINSFVLEYRLDPAWRQLGSTQLVTAILLQHLYTPFYELLVNEDSGEDPVGEFLDYVEVHDGVHDPPDDGDSPWWATVRRTFKAHRLLVPEGPGVDREKLAREVADLERELPESFPEFVRNRAFVALLRGVGDSGARRELRAQLVRRPLATATVHETPQTTSAAPFAGRRIVCIDDNPLSLDRLVHLLEQRGATVEVYSSPAASDQEIQRRKPDAVISDIARGEDPSAGFAHVSRLRDSGYDGPVVFFTGRVTPERRSRADELGAIDVVTSERAVIDALRSALELQILHWAYDSIVTTAALPGVRGLDRLGAIPAEAGL